MADRARPTAAVLLLAAGVALLAGLALGGLGPRAEIRELRAEVTRLEERPCDPRAGTRIFSEVLRARGEPETPSGQGGSPPPSPSAPRTDAGAPEVPEQDVERIKEALDLRRAQSITALHERAGADEAQMGTVEDIAAEMNGSLRDLATEFVAAAKQSEDGLPTRREAMVFAADALDILIDAEDAMWSTLDDEQAAEMDPDLLDPTAFVDGSVLDVMSGLDQR